MRKIITITICVLVASMTISGTVFANVPYNMGSNEDSIAAISTEFDVAAKSAVLMDYNTGTVLYEKNANEALPPASVTKIMTLLLIMEAVDSGKISFDDNISVSEYAASMGGSQVFLEPGETMCARDLIKSIVIASANDSAVTMAEAVSGSESAFVTRMNERALELGMLNTHFENVTGLDDDVTNHVTSARDIAIMSRELMKHEKIFEFTTVWMDSIRNGEFGLTNTNRLIRFYDGATGLKTGSTSKAKFCISATAKKGDLHLIAVIMGAETRDARNDTAKTLLDWGFSNYSIYKIESESVGPTTVTGGVKNEVSGHFDESDLLLEKGIGDKITKEYTVSEELSAPICEGQKIGTVKFYHEENLIHECDILADEDVPKISFFELFRRVITKFLLK